ncbi:MAG: site-specific DNA-methyltransferase [Desulfobulbia bacterium]
MPTLDWIGKKAVVNHHRQVPFHLLRCNDALSVGDPGSGNLLVQGDNLVALKALLPYYAGQVKCIYIDPPYNTGEEKWTYNDNVNSPEMREWLGKAVGKEAEDLSRHDKWLCMMYPRLVLLREFLRDDGAIFISIDDNEVHFLRMLMDEIFGSGNFITQFVWEKRKNRENRKVISIRHDHIICYGRNSTEAIKTFNPLPMNTEALARYKNPDNDRRGPWKSDPATAQAGHGTKSQFYVLTAPNGKQHQPPSGRCWVYTEEVMMQAIDDGRIWLGEKGTNVPRIKTFLNEKERGLTPESILFAKDVSTNEDAKNSLKRIFGGQAPFETPKPTELVAHFIAISTNNEDIVMDSFAGSGTTGHAVLTQNASDGNRRFILIEMDENICQNITSQRLSRVSQGYGTVPALGGGFRFCELGEPLFDESGKIRQTVRFADLARHVYFIETGEPLPAMATLDSPLLGVHNGTAVYLLYNGILKDKSPDGGNVLTRALFAMLPEHDGQKVIYGTACKIGPEQRRRGGIVFKQLPYKLKTGVL